MWFPDLGFYLGWLLPSSFFYVFVHKSSQRINSQLGEERLKRCVHLCVVATCYPPQKKGCVVPSGLQTPISAQLDHMILTKPFTV